MSKRHHIAILATLTLALGACSGEQDPGQGEPPGGAPIGGGVGPDQPAPFEPGETCVEDDVFFQEELWRPLLSSQCAGCHNNEGVASGTRLLYDLGGTAEAQAHNVSVTSELAREIVGGTSLLLLKPTGEHVDGHVGGAIVKESSPEYRALATFVARVHDVAGDCDLPVAASCDTANPWPGKRRIRRLSHAEYDRTLSDLFGRPIDLGESLSSDVEVHGYRNNAGVLVATPLLVEQWLDAAERLSEAYVSQLPQNLPCASQGGQDCARDFIRDFGARAFRRPMTDADVNRYVTLFDAVATQDGFTEGIRDVMTALLVSPHFLYRTELGELDAQGVYALTPHEIAAELAYLLTGTMPDAELLAAADAGALRTPDEIEAQARRLLADPRGAAHFKEFVFQWLEIERLETAVRDPATYPGFAAVRGSMIAETETFIEAAFDGGEGSLGDLLTSRTSYVDAPLAAFYGIDGVPDDGGLHPIEVDAERAGIFGQGAVLATHSFTNSSSPTYRGLLVRERALCQELPPPPPGLDTSLAELEPGMTVRERFERHAEDNACAGCHVLVDPIGFAFEHYDGVGRWRETYADGQPIDDRGEIVLSASSDTTFEGLGALTTSLADSPDVPACFTTQWVRFGYAVADEDEHACTERALLESFTQGGHDLDALLVAMTRAPHFTHRAPDSMTPAQWYGEETFEPGDPTDPTDPTEPTDPVDPVDPVDPTDPTDPPPADGDLEVVQDNYEDWGQGYCAKVFVTNNGGAPKAWSVTIDVGGTMTTNWQSNATAPSGVVTFTGVQGNATLAPGETAEFGFCVQR